MYLYILTCIVLYLSHLAVTLKAACPPAGIEQWLSAAALSVKEAGCGHVTRIADEQCLETYSISDSENGY